MVETYTSNNGIGLRFETDEADTLTRQLFELRRTAGLTIGDVCKRTGGLSPSTVGITSIGTSTFKKRGTVSLWVLVKILYALEIQNPRQWILINTGLSYSQDEIDHATDHAVAKRNKRARRTLTHPPAPPVSEFIDRYVCSYQHRDGSICGAMFDSDPALRTHQGKVRHNFKNYADREAHLPDERRRKPSPEVAQAFAVGEKAFGRLRARIISELTVDELWGEIERRLDA